MKLTKSTLKQMIREELEASLEEQEMIGTLTPIYPKNKYTRGDGKKRVPGDVGQYEPAVPAFDPELAKDRAPEMAKMVSRGVGGSKYTDVNDPRVQREEAHIRAIKAFSRLQKLKDNPFANPAEIEKAEKEYKRLSKIHPRRRSPGFPLPGQEVDSIKESTLRAIIREVLEDMV